MYAVVDVMASPAVTVGEDATYRQLVDVICGEPRISGVPVVDAQHRVVGVVSEADLMLRQEFPDDEQNLRWIAILGALDGDRPKAAEMSARLRKAEGTTAAQLMSTPPIVIGPKATLKEAATLMDRMGVKRLIVVEEGMHPVGVVTRSDLLKVLVAPRHPAPPRPAGSRSKAVRPG